MKAIWNDTVIAESDQTIEIEGNQYFPADSVNFDYLKKNGDQYTCPWKGLCDYYDVTAKGETSEGGAWIYPQPSDAAKEIAGYVAFWQGVEMSE